MNKSTLVGMLLGIAVATAAAGFAGYAALDDDGDAAQTAANTETAAARECRETTVERHVEPRDENRVAGTIIGALVGGAVGKDVGDRDITTAAGAAAGAYAGNQVQKKIQENHTVETTEVRC